MNLAMQSAACEEKRSWKSSPVANILHPKTGSSQSGWGVRGVGEVMFCRALRILLERNASSLQSVRRKTSVSPNVRGLWQMGQINARFIRRCYPAKHRYFGVYLAIQVVQTYAQFNVCLRPSGWLCSRPIPVDLRCQFKKRTRYTCIRFPQHVRSRRGAWLTF